jgi:hypothetical protein
MTTFESVRVAAIQATQVVLDVFGKPTEGEPERVHED